MAGRWRELFGSDEERFRSRLAFGQSHAESSSANVAREDAPGGEYFNGLPTLPRIQGRGPGRERATTGMHPHDLAVIRPYWALSASGSVFESTLPRAMSRGRRSRPPDRRKGISSAQP